MLLTAPQKSILELLSELKCLRKDQIVKIIIAQYNLKNRPVKSVHSMLDQMERFGEIVVKDKFISRCAISGKEIRADASVITAVDVMLQVSGGENIDVHKGDKTATIFFTVTGKDGVAKKDLYAVIVVGDFIEHKREKIEDMIKADVTVILVVDNKELVDNTKREDTLGIAGEHYCAVKVGEWKYRYFEVGEKRDK